MDLQTEHERYLTEELCRRPVVVMNYPKDIKAFYMRLNDDGRTVAAMDVLAPGIGEIIGGSQREERLDVLDARLDEMKLPNGRLLVVPRPAPLRHRAARRLRPGLRAGGQLRHRHGEHPRRHPLPARAESRPTSERRRAERGIMEWRKANYRISDDKSELDLFYIVPAIQQSYWASAAAPQDGRRAVHRQLADASACTADGPPDRLRPRGDRHAAPSPGSAT